MKKELSMKCHVPRTRQQNGVVERKNRTLQEMARTMISEYGLPQYLCVGPKAHHSSFDDDQLM